MVVVLPVVPVTPATSSSRVGWPKKAAAAAGIAARVSSRTTCGTSSGSRRSTASATAPCSSAAGAKSCPSAREPATQKNSDPGRTPPAAYARSAISTESSPTTSVGDSAALSSRSLIDRRG